MTHRPRQQRRPQRTCVACRQVRDKTELLRIVATPEGARFDPRQQLAGRGAYLCADPSCVATVTRRNGHPLRRALRGQPAGPVRSLLEQLRTHLMTRHNPRASTHPGDTTAATVEPTDPASLGSGDRASAAEQIDALRGGQEYSA